MCGIVREIVCEREVGARERQNTFNMKQIININICSLFNSKVGVLICNIDMVLTFIPKKEYCVIKFI